MNTRQVKREEIKTIYDSYMKKDFPPDELKPLSMMEKMFDEGTYEGLIFEEEGETKGYAFFYRKDDNFLFDYLAVVDGNRNSGIGSEFLSCINEHYKDAFCLFGEVEDPDCDDTKEGKDLKNRRKHFYLRNGYVDTGARVKMYGVDYVILRRDGTGNFSKEEMEEIYKDLYRVMFTKEQYKKYVIIK